MMGRTLRDAQSQPLSIEVELIRPSVSQSKGPEAPIYSKIEKSNLIYGI
jgi:hypothetical protein